MMDFGGWLDQYWFPALLIGVTWLAINIGVAWLVIFTAVRAALRSVRDDEHELRSGRYGLPPRI